MPERAPNPVHIEVPQGSSYEASIVFLTGEAKARLQALSRQKFLKSEGKNINFTVVSPILGFVPSGETTDSLIGDIRPLVDKIYEELNFPGSALFCALEEEIAETPSFKIISWIGLDTRYSGTERPDQNLLMQIYNSVLSQK